NPRNHPQLDQHHRDGDAGGESETRLVVGVGGLGDEVRQAVAEPAQAVMSPQTAPRAHGLPRPVRLPSSDSASAKPMLMPAPTLAARPTRNVSQLLCVAKAAANSGARVETEPSINPASPG